jgi:thiaminase
MRGQSDSTLPPLCRDRHGLARREGNGFLPSPEFLIRRFEASSTLFQPREIPKNFPKMAATYTLPFAPGNFVEYLLSRPDVAEAWKQHTEHVFLERLADGTLPIEAFKYYLIQDYLYLIQFARANSLAGYKTKNLEDIVLHINREMNLHLGYCAEFGLSKEDILKVEESQACTAYTRFVLDTGASDDWPALQIALAPCLIGYGVIAKRLFADPKTLREGNRYWKWIENYVAEDYSEAVVLGIGRLVQASKFENGH